jgi:DNA-binding transcriptional ArsR family regulator
MPRGGHADDAAKHRPRQGGGGAELSAVVLRDPGVMRALAHPRRMQLLRHLRADGAATATLLGEATGQSPASASYHLRQLAAHGLVEEVRGRGVGRERWWRARHGSTRVEAGAVESDETRMAAMAVTAAALADADSVVLGFLDAAERGGVAPAWVRASRLDDTSIYATPQELAALGVKIAQVLEPYRKRGVARRPATSRLCLVTVRAVPVVRP